MMTGDIDPTQPTRQALINHISAGERNSARGLIEKGADWNVLDSKGRSLLDLAIDGDDLGLLRFLLEKGFPAAGLPGQAAPPLVKAAANGRCKQLQALLAAGAPLDARTEEGAGPLRWALRSRSQETVEAILSALGRSGAPHVELLTSVLFEDLESVKALVKSAGPAGGIDEVTPIWLAVLVDNADLVALLGKAGADVNVSFSDTGASPLCFAAAHGSLAVGKALVRCGARVDHVVREGMPALWFALKRSAGGTAWVRFLLEQPVKPPFPSDCPMVRWANEVQREKKNKPVTNWQETVIFDSVYCGLNRKKADELLALLLSAGVS